MSILGMIGTEQLANQRFKNVRRSVMYDYPNGSAPLLALLSLLDEESTNDPEFSWWEKRYKEQKTLTVSIGSSKGPFFANDGTTQHTDGNPFVAKTSYTVRVADSSQFHIGHVIRIPITTTGQTLTDTVIGAVTGIDVVNPSNPSITFKCLKAVASVDNGTTNDNVGVEVLAIGTVAEQGAVGAGLSVYNIPTEQSNYTQIFRNAFRITGTNLKTSIKYDDTGVYADQAKEASMDHLIGLERAFLFGEKTKNVDTATSLPTYTTGGLLWFLQQWELTSNNPYGMSGATADTDDNKRIIENAGGFLTEKAYDGYLERVFRSGNNKANERLCFCGSGALNVINRMYKGSTMLCTDIPVGDTYGMSFVKHVSPFGTVYYKTHPLFTLNQTLRNSMLFVDLLNLKYRYIAGRDSTLLKNRQPNNADYREDEWFCEAGMEVHQPESNMFIKNVQDYR